MNRLLNVLIIWFRIVCAVGAILSGFLLALSVANLQFDLGYNLGREDIVSGVIFLVTILAAYCIGMPIMRFIFRSWLGK